MQLTSHHSWIHIGWLKKIHSKYYIKLHGKLYASIKFRYSYVHSYKMVNTISTCLPGFPLGPEGPLSPISKYAHGKLYKLTGLISGAPGRP